jgi:hypothetical protein
MHKGNSIMATLTESMDLLKSLIARGCEHDRERYLYTVEWRAFYEVLHGDPYNESRYCHADERYAYRAARERAEIQKRIQGI